MDPNICGDYAVGFDADPFRNGIDCCCEAHTCAGRYKRSITALREGQGEMQPLLDIMEESCLGLLMAGLGMAKAWSRIYVLEVLE